MRRSLLTSGMCLVTILAGCVWRQAESTVYVTPTHNGIVHEQKMPTGQIVAPVGELVTFHGRPVDIEVGPNQDLVFVKDRHALRVIEIETMKEIETIASPGGASLYGLAVTGSGTVLFTDAKNGLCLFAPVQGSRRGYSLARTIALPADSFPCGVTLSTDGTTAYVCLSKKNAVVVVDIETAEVTNTIDVGVAPFDCRLTGTGQLVVSNIGGRASRPEDPTAPSAGTDVVVDHRGIASTGTLSVIDLETMTVVRTVETGRHPSVLSAGSDMDESIVCNTNDDSVMRLRHQSQSTDTFVVKPKDDIPFGSMPSAIIPWPNQGKHFIGLAGNNAIAVADLSISEKPILGLVPTAWYPVGLSASSTDLFVACVKGLGSRSSQRDVAEGRNSHDHLGTIQKIPLADIADPEGLLRWTQTALEHARLNRLSPAIEQRAARDDAVKPVPIPAGLGQPSVFKHVIYVIKENRTYDQVFGDLEEARGEPDLCVFPEEVSPNHHALARRFGILDNYYCNGVLSADGHSWATEGNVTPYLERAFGGFARSYTFGDDPITYSSSGFLWDQLLDAGLSFRNYGELIYSEPPDGMKYQDVWQAYEQGQPITFTQKIGIERLRRYSCPTYPGWNMVIPDVLRMDRFLAEFREFEQNGQLPSLCLVYLPQDHFGGGITSRSHMADNDLAVGRLVEAVSHSAYWKETVIFVNEDDPQNGYDHIDGHRSLCLTISPYNQAGVNHQFFNQTSVLRTILHIFGLPPMNQQDGAASLMKSCFREAPDFTPYAAINANFSLHEAPEPKEQQSAAEREWRTILATVPIGRTGMKTEQDEDNLNRFVWHEMRGWTTPYPAQWAGAHGKGLGPLGLRFSN